ncbi:MAG: C25 family cysteine peptidase, partial [Candidatus Cloacimonetes bacterium]|nr:C25 family cysteine peptidase [Candidatus Cloacimonadota bacterium]
ILIEKLYISSPYTLDNLNIHPSQNYEAKGYTFDYDTDFYQSKDRELVYPNTSYHISEVETMRDHQFITINVHPMRYRPAKKSLEITDEISMTIYHRTLNPNPSYYLRPQVSRYFEVVYEALFENYNQIRLPNPIYQEPSLLIVHGQMAGTGTNLQFLNQLVTWKKQRGMKVETAVASATASGNSVPAGTSQSAIKSFIQNKYNQGDVEFVLFVGACGTASSSNFNVPSVGSYDYSDWNYMQMTPGDYPDIFVGRWFVDSSNALDAYVSKVIHYEREINVGNTNLDWLGGSLLVGDTASSSGISTKIINKYIKSIMQEYDPAHNFTEFYPASAVNATLNTGKVHFSFRGIGGMAGIPGQVSSLTNNNKLFNAVAITCGTGGMNGYYDDYISLVTKKYSSSALTGAISAVGMQNSLTHTAWNNVLQGGIYYGLYPAKMETMGQATLFSKCNIINTFNSPGFRPTAVNFASWLNLMGDPSHNVFKTKPKTFSTVFPTSIPTGTNSLRFEIKDQNDVPVPNTWVTVSQFTGNLDSNPVITYLSKGISDENGVVYINLDPELTGNLTLFCSRADFLTKKVTISPTAGAAVSVQNFVLNDVLGNNNGEANPGETIHLTLNIKNYQSIAANNLTATLTSEDPLVTIDNGTATLSNISAGGTQNYYDAFTFTVSPLFPDLLLLPLKINITDGTNIWTSYITTVVKGVNLNFVSMTPNYVPIGQPSNVSFSLKNNGSYSGFNLSAQLLSRHSYMSISDNAASIGTVLQGQTVNNIGPFTISVADAIYPGMSLPAVLYIYNNDGFEELLPIRIQAGNRTPTDPTGPDEYGYAMIGSNDLNWYPADTEVVTPQYRWINAKRLGTNTGITDYSSYQEGGALNVTLPFTASYYGNQFDNIFICSNGWFCFGTSDQRDFRNVPIPGPIVPRNMVAPYWTDLAFGDSYGGGVYTYYDQQDAAYVIQWDSVRFITPTSYGYWNVSTDSVTFQAIIYDPEVHGTSMGDSPIKLQYHRWNPGGPGNVTHPMNYVSVGFQDGTALRGLTYVYDNIYTPGSAPITNGFAILITQPIFMNDRSYLQLQNTFLYDENGNGIIEAGESLDIGVVIKNIGLTTAEEVRATLTSNSDFIEILNDTSDFHDIPFGESSSNFEYLSLLVSPDTPDNTEITINIKYSVESIYSPNYNEWSSNIKFIVRKPSMVYRSYLINDSMGNDNGIVEPGETIKLIAIVGNTSDLDIYEVMGNILSQSPYLTINQDSYYVPNIRANNNQQFIFEITVAEDTPVGTTIPLYMTFTPMNANTVYHNTNLSTNQSTSLLVHPGEVLLDSWQINGLYGTWSISDTNYAGGTPPEIKYTGTNVTGRVRYISPTMDARNINSVIVTFKNAANVDIPDVLTLQVEARHTYNSNEWEVMWSQTFSESYGASDVAIPLNTHLGGNIFQISFTLVGNFAGINEWFLDEIIVQTDFGNTATVMGNVNVLNHHQKPIAQLGVKADYYTGRVKPDSSYVLYLLPQTYHSIALNDPDYEYVTSYTEIAIAGGQAISDLDMNVYYRTRPGNLRRQTTDERYLTLKWDHVYNRTEDFLNFVEFEIFKQANSTEFVKILQPEIDYLGYDSPHNRDIYSFTDDSLEPFELLNKYRYSVRAKYARGYSDTTMVYYDPVDTYDDPDNPEDFDGTVGDNDDIVPAVEFALYPNYPNPFNPSTTIKFAIPAPSKVDIKIYNIKGQLVKTLKNEFMDKGIHSVQWHGNDNNDRAVATGIYFIRIQNEKNIAIRKSLLMK